ncbi:DUF2254 domain-containing protein [Methylophaga sp.]|jgi:uncharacterized membrane protein|uniref:DUF2254 domain-containing protein n=1 Tax=Methylophaga sp. TaxID=2024840 RepID=UPI0013FE4F0A|nr:DUF2254 domain-containing protein [Methylophaga sp.]MTI62856.1 DUF2254 domain-containing protein [Methylophaga sp.]
MFSKWQWLLTQLGRKLWLRSALFALLAIFTALIAIPVELFIKEPFPFSIGAESVGDILNILASSMLAVTTFSLSVMVSAYTAASSSATPRATKLVRQDSTTQNVLATFIGSFLFSLVGIIALSTDLYGENGRLILFAVTIAVVVIIVVTMLRWIEHLSKLGRLGETTDRVEDAASQAIQQRVDYPCLGARRLDWDHLPDYFDQQIYPVKTGYVQHIDISKLNHYGEFYKGEISVLTEPGQFIHPAEAIACFDGELTEDIENDIRAAFTVGNERSFDQDPRFGLSVLAEIASRALSPAVNDPGTAIDIISRAVRLLLPWREHASLEDDNEKIVYPHVRISEIQLDDLFEDVFMPIARDGAGLVEIQLRLQKSLLALKRLCPDCFAEQVVRHSQMAYERAELTLNLDAEKQRLKQIVEKIHNE